MILPKNLENSKYQSCILFLFILLKYLLGTSSEKNLFSLNQEILGEL